MKTLPAYKKQQIKLFRHVAILLAVTLALTPLLGRALAAVARTLSAHP
jgi:hypothetical protein